MSDEAAEDTSPEEVSNETSAGQLGWVDQETWVERGRDPGEHISADAFMEKQDNNAGLAIKNFRRLSAQVADQQKTMVRMEEMMTKAHTTEMADLKAQMRKAGEEGDMATYDTHAASLEEKQKEVVAPVNTEVQDAAQSFVARVPEFNTDTTVMAVARQLETQVRSDPSFFNSDHNAVYAEVEKRLRVELPNKFAQPQAEVTPRKSVTPAGRPAQKGGKLSFNSLPSEDKAQFKKMAAMFKSRGKEYTEKQFMKSYAGSLNDA